MERISFDIDRQDVVDALHAHADAHGHTVQAELAALVEQTYGRAAPTRPETNVDNWVADLIAIARGTDLDEGIEPYLLSRHAEGYEPIRL